MNLIDKVVDLIASIAGIRFKIISHMHLSDKHSKQFNGPIESIELK